MCVCMHVHIHMYVGICKMMKQWSCVINSGMYVCMYAWMYKSACMCEDAINEVMTLRDKLRHVSCVYVYVYVCMHACTHTHVCVNTQLMKF